MGLRLPVRGPLEIVDQNGVQRWSDNAGWSDSFRLTDKGEVLIAREGVVLWAIYPPVITSLGTGGVMYRNQQLRSPDGGHVLIFQDDGNLVLYETPKGSGAQPRWASSTEGKGGSSVVLQWDGNLVMYTAGQQRSAIWASNSVDDDSVGKIRTIEVRNGGSLVLVQDGHVVKDLRS
ncbi:Comitin [Arthrobotrys entomopaga]|nr:Comitin [Arthrobotrys entomopaga]